MTEMQLAKAVNDITGQCSVAVISRLENPADFKGLSVENATALDRVLEFGRKLHDDSGLRAADLEGWRRATGLDVIEEGLRVGRFVADGMDRLTAAIQTSIEQAEQGGQGTRSALEQLTELAMLAGRSRPVQKWLQARLFHTMLDFNESARLLVPAMQDAKETRVPREVVGVMLHDLADAYLTKGELELGQAAFEDSKAQYRSLLAPGVPDDKAPDKVKLGILRADIQKFQKSVWSGVPTADCLTEFKKLYADLAAIQDSYGQYKAAYYRAYMHFADGDFPAADEYARLCLQHLKQMSRKYEGPWLIRDGLQAALVWGRLHGNSLRTDIRTVATGHKYVPEPWYSVIRTSWWLLYPVPPLAPCYAWRTARRPSKPADYVLAIERLHGTIDKMDELGVRQCAPVARLAMGDLLAESGAARSDVLQWYSDAKHLALDLGFHRFARMADQWTKRYREQHR